MSQSASRSSALPYRSCVGILLLDPKGDVFVGRRNDLGGEAWQMPQGGIDAGEAPEVAALRELAEETGIRSVEVLAETAEWLTYDYPPAVARGSFANRYRGQRQKWFAMRFTGREAEIDLGSRHAEFDDWRWRDIEDLPGLIVNFKRPVYEAVVREFRHLARPEI
jgi:putative (di)nucleoside polyphosphate hydrolase